MFLDHLQNYSAHARTSNVTVKSASAASPSLFPLFLWACMSLHVGICMCVFVPVEAQGWCWVSSSVTLLPYSLRQGLSINPRACRWPSLKSQLAFRVTCLHLPRLELQVTKTWHLQEFGMIWTPNVDFQVCVVGVQQSPSYPEGHMHSQLSPCNALWYPSPLPARKTSPEASPWCWTSRISSPWNLSLCHWLISNRDWQPQRKKKI